VRPVGSESTTQTNSGPQLLAIPVPEISTEQEAIVEVEKVAFITAGGIHKCCHAGCMKEYDPNENGDDVCEYHPGSAGFKDTKKFWSCCGASSYDWDEFMKIPKCAKGRHEPKMVRK
jgi:disease resistance protein